MRKLYTRVACKKVEIEDIFPSFHTNINLHQKERRFSSVFNFKFICLFKVHKALKTVIYGSKLPARRRHLRVFCTVFTTIDTSKQVNKAKYFKLIYIHLQTKNWSQIKRIPCKEFRTKTGNSIWNWQFAKLSAWFTQEDLTQLTDLIFLEPKHSGASFLYKGLYEAVKDQREL